MAIAVVPLIPAHELTPGAIAKIRNDVIDAVVALASKELSMSPDKLVVRDVRPKADLALYGAGTTALTVEDWVYECTSSTINTYTTITGAASMGDNKFVALFGVRDHRLNQNCGVHATTGITGTIAGQSLAQLVSLIKLNVGGADKVIWDTNCLSAYQDNLAAFTPSAVIIPQNAAYNIYYMFRHNVAGSVGRIQFVGVTVEPRGKLVSP